MSTKSVSSKITQPYAEAFFEIAKNNNSLNLVNKDAQTIINLVYQTKKLENFFINPLVSIRAKKEVIYKIFADSISNITLKFLLVLAERNRIKFLSLIMEKYLALSYEYASVELVRVYSATEMTESQKEALSRKLQEMTSANEIKLIVEVNPNLIGGFRLQIGSQVLDVTIKHQLNQLASSLGEKV
uniref:ATP synthase CF1 delta subunit n=1 Tax=Sciadococcus taiwanensis TaxID=3028030 RepID=A0A9Y1I260_9RHOD|nr:ATP synthase CF1 delta subunit [Sciadococcus taiwanensis]